MILIFFVILHHNSKIISETSGAVMSSSNILKSEIVLMADSVVTPAISPISFLVNIEFKTEVWSLTPNLLVAAVFIFGKAFLRLISRASPNL